MPETNPLEALPENMISLEEARARMLGHIEPLGTETVDLLDAAGRVASQEVVSASNVAAFPQVCMDGFAVKAAQIATASKESPVELNVLAEVAAGDWYDGGMPEGGCLRIMTGAPLPPCADSIVKYEIVENIAGKGRTGDRVAFFAPTELGSNVREAGSDARVGDTLIEAGEVVNGGGIGFLAGCGITQVPTYKRPRVAIIATGSELVDPSCEPGPGKIRNSNSYALAVAARDAGAIPTILPICDDTFEALSEAVKSAAGGFDMVVTTGGAAKGDYDFILDVVESLGEAYVSLINMRPGKAEVFGLVDGVPVFGLPGNPAAAYIGFHQLVRPALRKQQGYSHLDLATTEAKLAVAVKAKRDPRMTLLRAIISRDGSGAKIVSPLRDQSSGLFGPLQKGNALVVVPHGNEGLAQGADVTCVLLDVSEEIVL